ncbi:MAG: asparaginase [Alphaproteobacteria bacterium]|nr:asparaginase [Alphaproteobacteria bacterium]
MTANPVLVDVTRGTMVESRHRGAIAVLDAKAGVAEQAGDIDRPIYPRSAIKPLQTILLVESGAADRFALTDEHLTLASASHNGEPMHVERVTAWLARLGLSAADLECGTQMPLHGPSAEALVKSGQAPTAAHNNCSGKHSGFLSVCVHRGWPTKGYTRPDHPVQQALLKLFEELADASLAGGARGTDGCGIPVFGYTLRQMALALARLADPSGLAPGRAEACRRIQAAIPRNPLLIAGTGRWDSAVLAAVGRDLVVKGGAEGVHAAALPSKGLGIALKIDDGAGRASQIALGNALRRHGALTDTQIQTLSGQLAQPLKNWTGTHVGDVKPAF